MHFLMYRDTETHTGRQREQRQTNRDTIEREGHARIPKLEQA